MHDQRSRSQGTQRRDQPASDTSQTGEGPRGAGPRRAGLFGLTLHPVQNNSVGEWAAMTLLVCEQGEGGDVMALHPELKTKGAALGQIVLTNESIVRALIIVRSPAKAEPQQIDCSDQPVHRWRTCRGFNAARCPQSPSSARRRVEVGWQRCGGECGSRFASVHIFGSRPILRVRRSWL